MGTANDVPEKAVDVPHLFVKRMALLGMGSVKYRRADGVIVTVARVHPAYRHVEGWQGKHYISAVLPEDQVFRLEQIQAF